MSKTFETGNWESYAKSSKTLADMGNSRAEFFNALIQLIAACYQLPSGVSTEAEADMYWVDEEQFCRLVEAVFTTPSVLLYTWAQSAAGMYEIIKGQRYHWGWSPGELPVRAFDAHYEAGDKPPQQLSDSWIGHQPLDIREPSFLFKTGDKVMAAMHPRTAHLFNKIAAATADDHGLPAPLHETNNIGCQVEEAAFCRLVEVVFEGSQYWLYPWARYAAGMYDVIKGKIHTLIWDETNLPQLVPDRVYSGVEPPTQLAPHPHRTQSPLDFMR